jgi:peptide/nickel transport system permease protein
MAYFLFRRTIGFIFTLFTVSVVVFAVMNVLPGDPALTILGLEASDDAIDALRKKLGLNEPILKRYFYWIINALIGDFGQSHSFGVPVSGLISERLSMTVALAVSGMVLTIIIALTLGIGAAANHRKFGDWGVMAGFLGGMTLS